MKLLFPGRAPVCALACSCLLSFPSLSLAQVSPAGVTLAPVIVTAPRFTEEASKLPYGVSIVTAQQIRDAGVSTVNEALMKLLGVQGRADFYGGGDYALDLRGFGSAADNNMAVVVDGVRISEADQGGTRLAGIPIDTIERIEVVRGNAAVLYGEGSTAGAIVITTKAGTGTQRESSFQAYGAMGSFGLVEARAGGTIAAGGLSIDVAANARSSEGYRQNFRSDTQGISTGVQWRNDWLRVGVRHAQDELHTELPGALTAAQYRQDPSQTTHAGERADIVSHRTGAFAELKAGDWQLAFDAGQRDKSLSAMNPTAFAYEIDAHNQGVRARHDAPLGGMNNTFVAGVDRNTWTRVNAGFGSTADQTSKAIYVKDDLTLRGGTRLSAGLRREKADKRESSAAASLNESHTAWDLGVLQPLSAKVAVYARVGESFRFANADEFTFVGAPLRPQTSRDIDGGVRWTHQTGHAELRIYRSALNNEIGYDPAAPGPFGLGANVNFESTRRQGVEAEWQQRLNARWNLHLNAAYREAKFTSGGPAIDGKRIPLAARYTASAGVDLDIGRGHKLNGLMNVVSSAPPDIANGCSIPSYATADLRYAYQKQGVELALAVANVGDRKYYTQAFACAGGEATSLYPEAGRSFLVSVRVAF